MENKTDRLLALEGLRGLAAMSVVLFHFLVLFYPMLYYGTDFIKHSRIEDNIHGTPLNAFISGTFAVSIFFVLSGFVLTIGFFQTKKNNIIERLAVKRYFRLMIPALASVLVAWVLISLGLSHNNEAYIFSQSPALNLTWESNTNFFHALYEGSIGVFLQEPVYKFNSVLWTMQYEFVGSFIIFIVALIFGKSNLRWMVYLALILALYNTWFIGFIFGMLLADVYVNRKNVIPQKNIQLYGMLLIGIVLGSFTIGPTLGTFYNVIRLPWLNATQNLSLYTSLGALLVIISILSIARISKFMSSTILTKIGRYTYSLYLVHQPLIYTLGTGLFVLFMHQFGYNKSVILSFVITVPVIIVATLIFYKYIEVPSLKFAAYFQRLYAGEASPKHINKFDRVKYAVSLKVSPLVKFYANKSKKRK